MLKTTRRGFLAALIGGAVAAVAAPLLPKPVPRSKWISGTCELQDTRMSIRREAYMLEFFAYETTGASIGHTGGLVRAS